MPSRFLVNTSAVAMLALPIAAFAQSGRTDAQIQSDVQSKLRSDANLAGLSIGVQVSGGVVTLTGNAASEDQLTTAENDISSIQGITQIQDNLQVASAPAPQGEAPAGTQNEAQQAAQNAQPPADAQNDDSGQQPQTSYNQGYSQQQQPNATYGYNNAPLPPNMNNAYGPNNGGPGGNYGPGPNPNYQRPMHYAPGGVAATLAPNTVVQVRLLEPVTGGKTPVNTFIRGIVARDIPGADGIVLPRGAPVTLQVVDSKQAGHYKGGAVLALKMSNLTLGNQAYPITSDVWGEKTPGKGGNTAGSAVGGAAFGALLGAIAGGGPGAAIGAASGATVGGVASGAGPRPVAYVPAEGVVTFRLTAPLAITTVPPEQAKELAAAAPPVAPVQRRMGPPGYYRPYPYGYPYGYPPPPPPPPASY